MIQNFEPPAGAPADSDIERLLLCVEPSARDKKRLTDEFQLPAEFVRHSLDADERPHAEKLGGSYLAVFRIPCIEPEGAPALAAEIFLADLKTINQNVDALEDRLRESLENREVLELLRHQKSLVYFSTALEANLLLIERLQRDMTLPILEGDGELLDDALVETHQALEVARISRDILSEMMDAFASIISNNLNNVMRFLATVTVVLTVPILIASFWGMNVALPLAQASRGFALLVAASFLLSLVLVIAFRRKRWL